MTLAVAGLNHHTSPVEVRERLAFPQKKLEPALLQLHAQLGGGGAVILSTCNRVELYLYHEAPQVSLAEQAIRFLSAFHQLPPESFRNHLYLYENDKAVAHLFRVASSLDSMVVGEAQVLGQVHEAYLAAQSAQTTCKVINALFQRAFSVAKKVRSETSVGSGHVSVSSVAVDLAASIFAELDGKTVLVAGSGETAALTLRHLVARGAVHVLVVNRNPGKARAVAEPYGGEAITFDDLPNHLHRADIIIGSTSAPHFVLRPRHFEGALRKRAYKPVFAIDIAVPRDIEPAVGDIDNVYLYDMDDLEQVAQENLAARREEMERGLAIVERESAQFLEWTRGVLTEPALLSMTEEMHAIRERELKRTLAALPGLTEEQRAEIEQLANRIVKQILNRPLKHIKREAGHHDPNIVIHLARRFFGLDEAL